MPIATKTTTPAPPSNPAAMQNTAEEAKAAALKMLETSVIDDSTAPVEEGDKEPVKKAPPVEEDPDAQVDEEPQEEKKPDDEPKEEEKPKEEKKGLPDPLKNSFEKLAREKKELRAREEKLKAAEGRMSKLETVERLAAANDGLGVLAALGVKYSGFVKQQLEKGAAPDDEDDATPPPADSLEEIRAELQQLREESRQRKLKEGDQVLRGAVNDFVKTAAEKFPNIAGDPDLAKDVVEEMIRFTKETGAPPGDTLEESIQMAAEAVEEREEKALQKRLKRRGLTAARAAGDAGPAGTKSAVEPTASEVVKKSKTLSTSHATAPRGVGSTSVDPEDLRRQAVEMLKNLDE